MDEHRDRLIAAGVRNLMAFGYSQVNKKNILTDYVYSAFFRSMLSDRPNDEVAKQLISEIDANKAKP